MSSSVFVKGKVFDLNETFLAKKLKQWKLEKKPGVYNVSIIENGGFIEVRVNYAIDDYHAIQKIIKKRYELKCYEAVVDSFISV
jgi:hypothetical protein